MYFDIAVYPLIQGKNKNTLSYSAFNFLHLSTLFFLPYYSKLRDYTPPPSIFPFHRTHPPSMAKPLNPSFPNSFQRVQLPPFHINTPVSVSVATATAMYFHITKPVIYGGDFFRVVNSVMVQSIHRLTLIWFGDCYCLW